jgi:UDPglucose 6-dehydrogenase
VREAIAEVLKRRQLSFEFDVVSNPEFLKEGSAIEDFMRPDRIVIGFEQERAKELMERLYLPFVRNGHPILFMDVLSSEMTKYASNAFLATKISFMNELSRVCEKVGGDIEKIRRGMGTDPRIGFHFIYAGLGYGGSCFPKDVKALLSTGLSLDEPMHLLQATETVNQEQRQRFIQKVIAHFSGNLKGRKIALWGLAFKPGTDDIREAPAIDLIQAFLKQGAQVHCYDPVATENVKEYFSKPAHLALGVEPSQLSFTKDPYTALESVDALCLVTEWKCFREPDFDKMKKLMKTALVFDGRNQYEPVLMKKLGFQYYCVGRG